MGTGNSCVPADHAMGGQVGLCVSFEIETSGHNAAIDKMNLQTIALIVAADKPSSTRPNRVFLSDIGKYLQNRVPNDQWKFFGPGDLQSFLR